MEQKTYKQVLDTIRLPPDTPKTITCRLCGAPMRLLKINPYVAYWVHDNEGIIQCGKVNGLHPGRPMIAQNLLYYRKIQEVYRDMKEEQQNETDNTAPS